MLAQDIHIGRLRPVPAIADVVALSDGGRLARIFLTVLFVAVIALESSTADPLLAFGTYLHRSLETWTAFPVPLTPLEILLMVAVLVAVVSTATSADATRGHGLGWPVALFVVAIAAGFVRGVVGGGDMYYGVWEGRYLLYIPMAFIVARAAIRRAAHVTSLLRAGLIAVALFAVEGAYRKLVLINSGQLGVAADFNFEHEDSIFLATFLSAIAASMLFPVGARSRTLAMSVAPLLMFTLLASNRRVGIIALLVGVLIVALATLVARRKAFFVSMPPALVLGVLYVALFWNAAGVLGQPARAVRSLYEPDARDAASNLYRLLETYNLSATIHSDPVLGIGFGKEFLMVATLPDLSWWPFWRYEPHNNVLWIWLKLGLVGYLIFWFLIGSAISRAAAGTRRLADPQLRIAALFCLVAVVAVVVFAYVDLGLVSGRVTLFLGTVLGIISVLRAVDRPVSPAMEVRS